MAGIESILDFERSGGLGPNSNMLFVCGPWCIWAHFTLHMYVIELREGASYRINEKMT